MRLMNNSKTLFESFQENLSKLEEASFDKCQATLPLDNYHSMGIIVSDDGDTVQYMYSNGDEVYESPIEYNEDGEPYFKDEEGYEWKISDFLRTDYGPKDECSLNEDKLEPEYANVKSFYGKANVENDGNVHKLVSYSTPIMTVQDGKINMLCKPEHLTQTTLRHIREFLQQMGLEPLSKKELIGLINKNESADFNDHDLEIAKRVYKEALGDKKEFLRKMRQDYNWDNEDAKEYYEKVKDSDGLKEQDTTVKVLTSQREDRDYSITDITDLNKVADGDVQAPIDIASLLVDVDGRLSESYGADWGQINFQSTRYNTDTKDSNALFELCVNNKTYLMSMLLEENCSVLKVNNTKGQTIFKRKSNDITSLAESYIKQFLDNKEAEEIPECLKHMNETLHERLDFIKAYIDMIKSAPADAKDDLKKYAQNEIYGFVAELSDVIKAEEPTDEDKLELPTFDKMVEEVFGKEWVKVENTPDKIEVEGTETLKEADETEAPVEENPAEELDANPVEEPKSGLGTGFATFARKPSNIENLNNKVNYFTDGDASYLICQKEELNKDEFDKIQNDFLTDNQYCKSFEPLDLDNYSYNVIEFSCPDYDYKLLVDPSGFGYCRYVAKIGGNE